MKTVEKVIKVKPVTTRPSGGFTLKLVQGGRFEREGTYVYLWLIHVAIWQKPIRYCKAIILQLKINKVK